MAKVYKAVLVKLRQKKEKDNETIRSVFTPDPFEVEYQPGKIQTPTLPGSFLYAFTDPQVARAYIDDSSNSILSPDAVLRVYSAEADVVPGYPQVYYTEENIEKFWAERWWEFGLGWPHVLQAQPGTVWCRWIMLKDVEWTDGRSLKTKMKPTKPSRMFSKPIYQRQAYRY